jgi:isopenicillin-N epimerase
MFTFAQNGEAHAQELSEFFLLRPDVIFLNHGSFGACPRPVFEVYQKWQLELERQPVEFLGRQFSDLMRAAREALAAYVNAVPEDLVFVPNATTGLNIVARSLALGPGDEILASDQEYGALERTWNFLCRKTGAKFKQEAIALPLTTRDEFIDRFWAGVTPRTRVIFLSHITSPTALIFPVDEICSRARAEGILTIIDGAHALGQIPVDLSNLGCDFYSSNAHKWTQSPKGSAFLYARRYVQHLVEPLVVSWGYDSETPSGSRFIDEQEWTGTRDIAAYLSVPAAIEFMRAHDWEKVQARCHELAQYARQGICAITGLESLSPDSPEWYAQMVSLPLPSCIAEVLKQRLYDEFRIEVPIINWNGKQLIRVSIQAYNSRADVDALLEALRTLLPQVTVQA